MVNFPVFRAFVNVFLEHRDERPVMPIVLTVGLRAIGGCKIVVQTHKLANVLERRRCELRSLNREQLFSWAFFANPGLAGCGSNIRAVTVGSAVACVSLVNWSVMMRMK